MWSVRDLLAALVILAVGATCRYILTPWQTIAVTTFWLTMYGAGGLLALRARLRALYHLGTSHNAWQRDLLDRGYTATPCPDPACTAPPGHIHYLPPPGHRGQLTVWLTA